MFARAFIGGTHDPRFGLKPWPSYSGTCEDKSPQKPSNDDDNDDDVAASTPQCSLPVDPGLCSITRQCTQGNDSSGGCSNPAGFCTGYTSACNQTGGNYSTVNVLSSNKVDPGSGDPSALSFLTTPAGVSATLGMPSTGGTIGGDGTCTAAGTCTIPVTANNWFGGRVTGAGTLVVIINVNGFPQTGTLTFTIQSSTTSINTWSIALVSVATFNPYTCGYQRAVVDPVATGTGELFSYAKPMLDLGGPLPLFFQTGFSSFLNVNGDSSALGYNWMHSFDVNLIVSKTTAVVQTFGGGLVRFNQSGGTWTPSANSKFPYQLIASATNYRFVDPERNLTFTFNTTGYLTAIQDRKGNTLTVTQGPQGPTQVSDGLGRTLTFTYANNFLTKVTDQSGRAISFAYTGTNMTGVTDAAGNTTSYSYQAGNLITKTTEPMGNTPYTQTFDSTFRPVTQTDSKNNKTTFSYGSGSNFGTNGVTDPLGAASKYNASGIYDVTAITDGLNNQTAVSYDTSRRPSVITDPLGNKRSITYDAASGRVASVTDAQGAVTKFTWTPQQQNGATFHNLTQVTYADGTVATATYDANGNVTAIVDRAGKNYKFTYNGRGQVLTATNAAGGVTTVTYNNDGTVASVQSAAGDTTSYSYDALKRPVKVTRPDKTTASVTWDPLDRAVSSTDELGNVNKVAYDKNGNRTSSTDALGNIVSKTYDGNNLSSTGTDAAGNVSKFEFNALGWLTGLTNGAGEKTVYQYDKGQNLTGVVDPAGNRVVIANDAAGRPVAVTDATGRQTKLTRDKNGLPVRLTTPLNEQVNYTYDAMRRITGVTDPLGRQTTAAYEARGLPSAVSEPGGVGMKIGWGDLPVVTSITDPNGNQWSVTNDAMGRRTGLTDPLGQAVAYSYDSRNRVSGRSTAVDSIQWMRDAAGNIVAANYSDGTSDSYNYDAANRLVGGSGFTLAYDGTGALVNSNGIAVARDAAGRILSMAYGDGLVVNYTYDSRGMLQSVMDWTGGGVTFTLDAASRVTQLARMNGVKAAYTYDGNGRLASITETGAGGSLASIKLTRDANGRVTAADRTVPQEAIPNSTGTVTSTFDAANQIAGATHDAAGRLTVGDGGASAYTWTPASRLAGYVRADGASTLAYDGLGSRTGRGTTQYVVNYALGLPSPGVVRNVAGGDVRYYVHTPSGELLYSIEASDGTHRYYAFDDTGSTMFLTDDTGAITDAYGISPYGDVVTPSANNVTDNPFTWQGRYGVMQEPGTTLYYMRARFYDANLGRFLTRDPVWRAAPKQVSRYQYAGGNPVGYHDPTGLVSEMFPAMYLNTTYYRAPVGVPVLFDNFELVAPLNAYYLNQTIVPGFVDPFQPQAIFLFDPASLALLAACGLLLLFVKRARESK